MAANKQIADINEAVRAELAIAEEYSSWLDAGDEMPSATVVSSI